MPNFLRYFDTRWTFGDYPCTNSRKREMGGWMRFDEKLAQFDEVHLVGLVDVWPPAVLPHLKERAPASSLTWTMELLEDPRELAPVDFWQYQVITDSFADGYGQCQATVWDDRGRPVALSRQTVVVFG